MVKVNISDSVFKVHADGDPIWDKGDHDGEIDFEAIIATVYEQMRTLGGEDQIPFLVNYQRDVGMCESDDITKRTSRSDRTASDSTVDYLKEYYA